MTHHAHGLMTPTSTTGIGRVTQTLGRRYVRYINQTYRRSGTLWEGRYHASLVQGDHYLLTCYRYIELNPVRTNITEVLLSTAGAATLVMRSASQTH
jgi:putative transposase